MGLQLAWRCKTAEGGFRVGGVWGEGGFWYGVERSECLTGFVGLVLLVLRIDRSESDGVERVSRDDGRISCRVNVNATLKMVSMSEGNKFDDSGIYICKR